jgi:hypothetical protein
MRYRKEDASGDFVFGNQDADFYRDQPEAVAQAVKTRLGLYTGEWFLDTTDGTPWRTEVLGKYTKDAYDSVIKARILDTQGVDEILDYSSSFDGNSRALTITATINTQYGETPIATTL